MSRRFLYRRWGFSVIVIVAMGLATAPWSAGQGRPQLKRPEQVPQEKPREPKKKPVKGPRAVGILQISGGKMTLIPVAILVEKRFYDASVYKAEPVPMALEGGTVYEAERNGESQGLFTVNGALHSKYQNMNPWVGTGSYLANGAEAAKTSRKAEDVPVGLDNSGDEPPRLKRGNAPKGATPAQDEPGKPTTASGQPAPKDTSAPAPVPSVDKSTAQGSTGQGNTAQSPASTERKTADQGSAGQSSPMQSSSDPDSGKQGSGNPSSANPVSANPSSPQAAGVGVGPSAGQPEQTAENYYRPTLRRGKPTQAAPQEEDAAPEASKSAEGGKATVPSATQPVQLEAAISDAGGPEPRSYKYFWKEGEEDDRRKQMLELAAKEVKAYVNARAKGAIPAKGAVTKSAVAAKSSSTAHKAAVKAVEPEFENIQFQGFDVWTNNQPVMILSAEASVPGDGSAALAAGKYSITLAARTDIYGNLRKLYSGVTDKFHLDVAPRLELIDVVDADGDGRGELLFRETSDVGSGYVIYRATADMLWKMFDSLGGE